jgi:CheY-like chemotaxis protein
LGHLAACDIYVPGKVQTVEVRMPYRVLVVEDNPDHIFLINRMLSERSEIESVTVHQTGEEALEGMLVSSNGQEPAPHFLLLDLKLPGMSGLELLARLREKDVLSKVPVFVLTSSDRVADRAQCDTLGASGYFLKPLMDEDLDVILARVAAGLIPGKG